VLSVRYWKFVSISSSTQCVGGSKFHEDGQILMIIHIAKKFLRNSKNLISLGIKFEINHDF